MSIDVQKAAQLGMNRPIARRDIIAGTVVAATGAAVMKALPVAAQTPRAGAHVVAKLPDYYPPKLTGLRGQYPGSFESAHLARDGGFDPLGAAADTGESYDLVIVGAGISGMSAAYFFRELMGPNARVLLLDNHDDFGGHAKRNEFHHEGRLYLAYGGVQSIESPYPYSFTAQALVRELGIDVNAYPKHVRNDLYKGMERGVFFDKETFGADKLVVGQGRKPWAEFFAEAPLSESARAELTRLYTAKTDYMPGLDAKAKATALKHMSYQQFLTDHAKISAEAVKFFAAQGYRNNMRVDTCPAYTAAKYRAPGFAGMEIDSERNEVPDYNFHFPDGNATITRLLSARLVPGAWGNIGKVDLSNVTTAMVDYTKLDVANDPVRIRLQSTVVNVTHDGDAGSSRAVNVTYVKGDKLYRVRGSNVIMACFNNIIPYILPTLPAAQKEALAYASKVPMQYTNVFLRNWKAFKALNVRAVTSPGGYHNNLSLDFPVDMQGYSFAQSPDDPIVVHMTRNPNSPGLPRKEQHRIGRNDMLATSFETIEYEIRSQMARTLAGGGFDPAVDILGITANRWPHGYSYTYDTLGDPVFAQHEQPHVIGRKLFGRIAIANADSGAAAFTNEAIDQAHRAVNDCLYSRGLV